MRRPPAAKTKPQPNRCLPTSKTADRVRSGLRTSAEDATVDYANTPIAEHVEAFETSLNAAGVTANHRKGTLAYIKRIADECKWQRLADLTRESLETWLAAASKKGMGARTRNAHHTAVVSFARWCADPKIGRLLSNPFSGIAKLNEDADPRRKRPRPDRTGARPAARGGPQPAVAGREPTRQGQRAGQRQAKTRDKGSARSTGSRTGTDL